MEIFWGELIGTMILIRRENGAVANVLLKGSKGHASGWIVITAGWGFAVAIAAYIAGWVSGAHINPAITLALAIAGKSPWSTVPLYCFAQLLGAMLGAVLVWLTYYPHWKVTENMEAKFSCFATKPAIRNLFWNFVTECIATFVLVFGVLAIMDPHNQVTGGMVPYLVGILVFVIGLSLGGPTGYAINPARDLGPRIMYYFLPVSRRRSFDITYAWVPILGPFAGGALAALGYQLFFSP
ncbi:MAG: aquaporin family protein [Chlamydiae bacterium]|nr:aquaporin family protein [Chlamydiota bacterium]